MESKITRLESLVIRQGQTIDALVQKNEDQFKELNAAIVRCNEQTLMVKKLDGELVQVYKIKGLGDKMDMFYALGSQRDAIELSLKELRIKYTKLEAKSSEQEKGSRRLEEEIKKIKKDNEMKEKLIISFKERVRKSDLNILTQTLRTIRYKMTVKRQLCMLLKIIVFQSRRKTLKLMKAAGEKKK